MVQVHAAKERTTLARNTSLPRRLAANRHSAPRVTAFPLLRRFSLRRVRSRSFSLHKLSLVPA